jgi:nicotinate-nucleotide pyrophosphorylase (carboxylating)
LLINVECQNLEEADEAVAAGANIVMLDNMVGAELHDSARQLKEKWKAQGREFLIETSGGIVEGSLAGRIGPGEWATRCNQLS